MSSHGFLNDAVMDLASQMEAFQGRLDELVDVSTVRHLEARLKAAEKSLSEVGKRLPKQAGPADDEAGSGENRYAPWHTLDDRQAERRWLLLRAWVEWLVVRNDIGPKELPACWYRHGGLVDELEALYWAWEESYRPDARGIEPIWWREALHRARDRWTKFNPNGCATTHSTTHPRAINDNREWDDFLAEDLAERPEPVSA